MNILSIVSIVLLPVGMNFSWVPSPCGFQYDWMYYHERKAIEYCVTEPVRKDYVLTHETGHYVWFELLNDTQREIYTNLWKKSKPDSFLSEYSKTNELEWFAEDFFFIDKWNSYPAWWYKRMSFVRKIYKSINSK